MSTKGKILYAEDELGLSMAVSEILKMEGFEVTAVMDGLAADEVLQKEHFDIAILDIMMPGMEGTEVASNMRDREDYTPVLLLTAKAETEDRIEGLNMGADDYLVKPFGMMELVSRVGALLRRAAKPAAEDKLFTAGSLAVDVKRRAVTVDGEPVILTYKEFELLCYLLENRGVVLSRDQILTKIWDYNYSGETRTVDVHIRTLRQKLGDAGALIETVRGVGYRLAQD